MVRRVTANCLWEASFRAESPSAEPALDVVFTAPDGVERRVPAFWAGDDRWTVRYASPLTGEHGFRTVCSNESDAGLHGLNGTFEVTAYDGDNPLLRHGPLEVAAGGRTLQHHDGTPFCWLGDTWWMGLSCRLHWPDEFRSLVDDRVTKGFSVIQLVAGLYPDQPAFDPRAVNEHGYPWTEDWGSLRPDYFDAADVRIATLVEAGLVPCIVGCWGYYLPWLGQSRMQQHWRHLVARWGAYPVVWCLAGEGSMPYYLSDTKEQDKVDLRAGWTEVARYVRAVDGFGRLVTIHPSRSARETVDDPAVLDFDMLQTGHSDRRSLGNTVKSARDGYATDPVMPVINGEVCYEGIGEACRQEVQRLVFWASWLSGASGFTYGANGIWQFNRDDDPYGPSPHGMAWGNVPWDEAARLPGSGQLGLAKRLLERYEWWRLEPHQEWVEQPTSQDTLDGPWCAGIPGELRLVYLPSWFTWGPKPVLTALEPGVVYDTFLWNGVDGSEVPLGEAQGDRDGRWKFPSERYPLFMDWLLVLVRQTAAAG